MERERFDGADVNHLLRAVGPKLSWDRLLSRFDRYWEVLLAQLMLFRFAYPSDRDIVPDWVMTDLLSRTVETLKTGAGRSGCAGGYLSRVNYRLDIDRWGYASGRERDEQERGGMGGTGSEIERSGSRRRVTSTAGRISMAGSGSFVKQVNEVADVLLLCGDLTDRGTPDEAQTLAEELSALRIPCVAVLGNHDYEGGAIEERLRRAGQGRRARPRRRPLHLREGAGRRGGEGLRRRLRQAPPCRPSVSARSRPSCRRR